jgi:hypothetical protein
MLVTTAAVRSRQRGLSLIELMISITLGLLILVAMIAVFGQNSRSFRQNDAVSEMQDSARFALDSISRDLSMAGYLGGVYSAANILPSYGNTGSSTAQSTPLQLDCGSADAYTGIYWFLQAATRVEFQDNTVGTSSGSQFPCLSNVQPNTDVVAIRRAAGQSHYDLSSGSSSSPVLASYTYYLQSNGTNATLIYSGNLGTSGSYTLTSTAVPQLAPMSFFKWVPRLYFIQNYSHTVGDGIPALCRMELQAVATPTFAAECLADGVQNLQIEWGLDTNNDCVPDTYTSTPTAGTAATKSSPAIAGQLAQAVTARIWLLVRASKPEAGFTDTKTYTLGNYTVPATNDSYRRRVYTTTVQLRNPTGSSSPCVLPTTGASR